MRKFIQNITQRLARWHQRHLPGIAFIHVVAIIIGLLAGLSAGLLKTAIDWFTHLLFNHFDMRSGNVSFFILPIAGIFIATLFTRYVVKRPLDHASDRIASDMAKGQNDISAKEILGPIIGCTFTLGMGGSAGAEDPIANTGAAIGSNIGKAFCMDEEHLGVMVGCGAAAGIAGIFMAPIGGVMFALEVLKMKQNLQTVLAIVLSSLVAALTCYLVLGCHTDITFVPQMRFDIRLIPYVLICGLVCGAYSLYYSSTMARCSKLFQKINNTWIKALTGGLMLAVMLFFFPSLYGEGYGIVRKLMIDDPMAVVSYGPLYDLGRHFPVLLLLMVVLLLVKPFATSATNDSGGVGGDFTPTFFCGGIAGFLFAAFCNHYLGTDLPLALFAFFGMAAVMAGAIRAPLMAIFIAAEMTGLYGFILPLTLAASISFLTTMLLSSTHMVLPFLHKAKSKNTKEGE